MEFYATDPWGEHWGEYWEKVKKAALLGKEFDVRNSMILHRDYKVYTNKVLFDIKTEREAYKLRTSSSPHTFQKKSKGNICLFIQQFKHDFIITDNYISIGNERHTWKYWDKNINKIGKANNYTATEIKETRELLKILKKQIRREIRK